MPFSESTVKVAWNIVGGKCDCKRPSHNHSGIKCNKPLVWGNRGQHGWGAWEARPIDGNPNNDRVSNCAILCDECCQK